MLPYIDYFDKGVARFPNREFLIDGQQHITFGDAADLTHRVADGLFLAGMGKEDAVATMAPNSAMAYICQWGVIRSGSPWLPVNIRNGIDENIDVLNRMRARFLFFDSALADDADRIIAEVPSLKEAVCVDRSTTDHPSLEAWLPSPGAQRQRRHARGPEDVVSIPTTSGTSGRPKGVMLTNASFSAGIANFDALMPYDVPPVTLAVAPLTHGAGYFAGTLIPRGGTIVMQRSTDPGDVLQAIEQHRVTTLFLPPTLLYGMLDHPDVRSFDYSSLRYLIMGAAPLSAAKAREALETFGPVLCNNYSQTEAPVTAAFMTPPQYVEAMADDSLSQRMFSVGTEAPYARIAIMDDEGNLLPPDSPGEIVIRGDLVMKGYFEDPEQTALASEHGWHHSGDVGYMAPDGYVYLVDRKKDMIISGGFNVYPQEIEQQIWGYPGIMDCAVVGIPDDRWGESVTAVIEMTPDSELDIDALARHLRSKLGGVKAPKQIVVWDRLPRSGNGKILKREIRDTFWQDLDRKI